MASEVVLVLAKFKKVVVIDDDLDVDEDVVEMVVFVKKEIPVECCVCSVVEKVVSEVVVEGEGVVEELEVEGVEFVVVVEFAAEFEFVVELEFEFELVEFMMVDSHVCCFCKCKVAAD